MFIDLDKSKFILTTHSYTQVSVYIPTLFSNCKIIKNVDNARQNGENQILDNDIGVYWWIEIGNSYKYKKDFIL